MATYTNYRMASHSVQHAVPGVNPGIQHSVITFTYPGTLSPQGIIPNPGIEVFLVHRNVHGPAYVRTLIVEALAVGNELRVVIGDWVSGPPGNTAQFCGLVRVFGVPNITVGGDPAEHIDLTSILPLGQTGAGVVVTGQGSTTVTIRFDEGNDVRGILNIGIYHQPGGTGSLLPIDPLLNAVLQDFSPLFNNGVNAYIAHFPESSYVPSVSNEFVALRVVETLDGGQEGGFAAPSIAPGYTIGFPTLDSVSITSDNNEPMYAYIMDDNFIQSIGTTYDAIVADGGQLPEPE